MEHYCRFHPRSLVSALLGALLLAAPYSTTIGAPFEWPVAQLIARPAEPDAIALHDGVAPGAEGAVQREVWTRAASGREIRNVTVPVLLPFLPAVGKANGTAVIIAPGGGFRGLAIDNEGADVARKLAAEGITAFVLKYRVLATPEDPQEFSAEIRRFIASRSPIPVYGPAVDDGRRALQLIRARASQWCIRADRIGLIGFSAGAMLTLKVSTGTDVPSRPDFVGIIYGPVDAQDVPPSPPPAFIALAADDGLFAKGDYGLVRKWQQAGGAVEFHLYGAGNHAFGMLKRGTTSDLWFDQLVAWLRMRGLSNGGGIVAGSPK